MYLSDAEAAPAKWNAIVEGFDVQTLAEQIASVNVSRAKLRANNRLQRTVRCAARR